MTQNTSYAQLAQDILIGGSTALTSVATRKLLDTRGLEFRKGKTAEDLRAAFDRVKRRAYPKIEFELSMMECELVKTLRVRKDS
jgi:hypothetical protein